MSSAATNLTMEVTAAVALEVLFLEEPSLISTRPLEEG